MLYWFNADYNPRERERKWEREMAENFNISIFRTDISQSVQRRFWLGNGRKVTTLDGRHLLYCYTDNDLHHHHPYPVSIYWVNGFCLSMCVCVWILACACVCIHLCTLVSYTLYLLTYFCLRLYSMYICFMAFPFLHNRRRIYSRNNNWRDIYKFQAYNSQHNRFGSSGSGRGGGGDPATSRAKVLSWVYLEVPMKIHDSDSQRRFAWLNHY